MTTKSVTYTHAPTSKTTHAEDKSHTPAPVHDEKPVADTAKIPDRIVVLEGKRWLAGTSTIEVFPAQMLTDPYIVASCLANGVRFHDVSDKAMPSRILIRRSQTIPAPRGGSVEVKVGEIVSDPWRVMCCANGGASFDIMEDVA
jgi:hypothetical protein